MASFIRSVLDLDKDNFEKSQTMSVHKAIVKEETPTKIKHVRSIILGTFQEKGCGTFWSVAIKLPLQSNQIMCWKFCHVLHKLLRDGHSHVLHDSMKYISFLTDLGRLWGHLSDSYGLLDSYYCKLLVQKLTFHKKHPKLPGNLEITEEYISESTFNDANGYFEFAVELLDLMDEVLNLQAAVFQSLDRSRASSMTQSGQCRLYPLILCIQDSCQLYDCLVKLLFRLHRALPSTTLEGHRKRFYDQFKTLQQFYQTCSNLQYYKGLIQVPTLPDSPPNFLIASELSRHRKPVAIVSGEDADDDDEAVVPTASPPREATPRPPPPQPAPPAPPKVETLLVLDNGTAQNAPDPRDAIIAQLKQQIQQLQNELEFVKTKARERILELQQTIADLTAQLEALNKSSELTRMEGVAMKKSLEASQQECTQLKASLESAKHNKDAAERLAKAEGAAKQSEEKLKKMKDVYSQLREEHIALLRTNGEVKKQAEMDRASASQASESAQQARQELEELQRERSVMKETLQTSASRAAVEAADLAEKLASIEKDKQGLTEQLEAVRRSLAESDSAVEKLKAEHSDQAARLEEQVSLLRQVTDERLSLQQQLSAAHDDAAKSGAALADAAARSATVEDSLAKSAADVARLQSELEAVSGRLAAAELASAAELRACREEIERLRRFDGSIGKAVAEGSAMIAQALADIGKEEYASVTCSAEYLAGLVRDVAAGAAQLEVCIKQHLEDATGPKEPEAASAIVARVYGFSHGIAQCVLHGQGTSHKAALEQGEELSVLCKSVGNHSLELLSELQGGATERRHEAFETVHREIQAVLQLAQRLMPRSDDVGNDVEKMVEDEMNATQNAVMEASAKIQDMLEKSRKSQTGVKLEVNERILDSCTELMAAIQKLIRKAKDLQEEIVSQGRGASSVKEFYKKNHRWTEGLISAAKTVGWGAGLLVEKAERLVNGNGKFEELIVCSHEIAASTAQLVVSSRVKADRNSKKMADLSTASKDVSSATGNVVASVKTGSQLIEEQGLMDFSRLGLHQTKQLEMDEQVHVLELESNLVKARKKLAELRRRHYQLAGENEGEEAQEAGRVDKN